MARLFDYFAGLDLGQLNDFSALSIIEEPPYQAPILVRPRVGGYNPRPAEYRQPDPPVLPCRHLQRWSLGTRYPAIVADVREMLDRPPLKGRRVALVVDATGVGRGIVDMFGNLVTARITIHGGNAVIIEGREYHVPKRDLIAAVQVLLQEDRLKIADALPEAQKLIEELLTYQVKISEATAHDSYDARTGQHDDLVLALCCTVWFRQYIAAMAPPEPRRPTVSFKSYN